MITIHMIVNNADAASRWYRRVFDVCEVSRLTLPDGQLIHVAIVFDGFSLMLADEFPRQGAFGPTPDAASPSAFYVHTDDVDAVWARALAEGATPVRDLADVFWGEREGQFIDPFGYRWGVTQHIADVTHDELVAGVAAMFSAEASP